MLTYYKMVYSLNNINSKNKPKKTELTHETLTTIFLDLLSLTINLEELMSNEYRNKNLNNIYRLMNKYHRNFYQI